MRNSPLVWPALLVLALLVTACASPQAAPPTAMPPTNAPPAASTAVMPVTGAAATVDAGSSSALGALLVDDKGMTLYIFTKDTPNTSTCYDKCATSWPPLLTTGKPIAAGGVDASMLGTTARTDGTTQVTYNGWPLYYFAKDKKAGDAAGENIGNVWFVISPAGEKVASAPAATATTAPAAAAGTMVNAGMSQTLGALLVDDKGMALYVLTKDTPNTSTCYNACAASWPPLLTTGNPVAGQGLDASKLGTTARTDGTTQVTYNGEPLYYYAGDTQPGETMGEGVGGVWFVDSPAGTPVKQAGQAGSSPKY